MFFRENIDSGLLGNWSLGIGCPCQYKHCIKNIEQRGCDKEEEEEMLLTQIHKCT